MIRSVIHKLAQNKFLIGVAILLICSNSGFRIPKAAADPLDNPLTAEIPNESINDTDSPIDPDYNPCAMTAYGEPLYLDNSPSVFMSVAEMETKYQRARMAFLFGNYEYAFKVWEPLAYQGYAKAQATLAWMFHTGKGIHKNMKRALAWYRVAADNDHAIAQNNLGVFYEQGIEVGKSYRLAAKWYKKSAEVGYAYAQYNLGVLYLKGKGVKKNQDEAIYWLQIASLQGVKQASALLETLGKQSAPHDEIHKIKPKQKYHSAQLPSSNPSSIDSKKSIYNGSWVASQNPEYFTVQVAGSDNLRNLLAFAQTLTVQNDLAYYKLTVNGKAWYNLVSGSYKNKASANKAKEHLPDVLKQWGPDVRKFSELQKIMITH